MPAHLRSGKDLSLEEQQRALLALESNRFRRTGDVQIVYELSEAAVERSRRIEERISEGSHLSFSRTAVPLVSGDDRDGRLI
jgi:hypothetical protein